MHRQGVPLALDVLILSRSRALRRAFIQLLADRFGVYATHPWAIGWYRYCRSHPPIILIDNAGISRGVRAMLPAMTSYVIVIMDGCERPRYQTLLRVHPAISKEQLCTVLDLIKP